MTEKKKKKIFVLQKVENIAWKGENAVYHDVFKRLLFQSHLKPIPTQWHLLKPLGNKPFENTVGKGEIACKKQFLLFPQCFLPIWITFCHFRQIWSYRLQTFLVWKSLKFVVYWWVKVRIMWKRMNELLRLFRTTDAVIIFLLMECFILSLHLFYSLCFLNTFLPLGY